MRPLGPFLETDVARATVATRLIFKRQLKPVLCPNGIYLLTRRKISGRTLLKVYGTAGDYILPFVLHKKDIERDEGK